MGDGDSTGWIVAAEHGFDRARRRAFFESVMGQLRGRPTSLLPFEEVKAKLGLLPSSDRGLHEIPLGQIVGSVGRYREFSRSFLPRDDTIRERWKRIYAAAQGMRGLPPIEVYQVGEVYFIKDGNHRVSVARQMGAESIQAYVAEFVSPVPLAVDTDLDDLILKAEEARFLQHTRLDELRPDAHIEVTSPGYYDKLEEHIAVHGYFRGLDERRDVSWEEAVTHWYEEVYLPMVRIIREHNTLDDFPGRTETDLYLWIMEHRHYLAQELGQEIDLAEAARHFAEQYSPRLERVVERAQQTVGDALTPDQLEARPRPGKWREESVLPRATEQLFADILVPIDGSSSAWCALDQALTIARHEQGNLYGLHVGAADADQEQVDSLHHQFVQRCEAAGVACRFITEVGEAAHAVCDRARWVDLVVLNRPGGAATRPERLMESTFETVSRRTSRPVLAVGEECLPLSNALLAYDASPTSEEALFVAAHLGKKWGIPLAVITVEESRRTSPEILDRAMAYLNECGVKAEGLFKTGPVAEAILSAARELGSDLLIMGGTGYSPFVELFLRSTIDHVLREATCPVLICR
jgi:nucleotide-binding universal stress UspA family protein